VYFDILSYTIENIIVCIFKNFEFNLINIAAGVYKLRLAETNFPSCYLCHARVYKCGLPKLTFFLAFNMYPRGLPKLTFFLANCHRTRLSLLLEFNFIKIGRLGGNIK